MITIRTSNWESMIHFYSRALGMETDETNCRHIVSLRGFGTVICLERVEDEEEKEVIGSLQFQTSYDGFNWLVENRGSSPFELITSEPLEMTLRDPDDNTICVSEAEDRAVA